MRPPGPSVRHRGAPAGPRRRRAALPPAGQVRSGAGTETEETRSQRPGEEEDAGAQRRLRPAPERHPEPGERQEALQIRDSPNGADLHRHPQRAAPGGGLGTGPRTAAPGRRSALTGARTAGRGTTGAGQGLSQQEERRRPGAHRGGAEEV